MKKILNNLTVVLITLTTMISLSSACNSAATESAQQLSTSNSEQVQEGIAQVWDSDSLVGTGIVVNDGTEVLTLLSYYPVLPDDLYVIINSQKLETSRIVTDFRDGATLLKINGGPFPTAALEDASKITLGNSVFIRGWTASTSEFNNAPMKVSETLTKDDPPRFRIVWSTKNQTPPLGIYNRGCVVADSNGKILGFIGYDIWDIFDSPSPPFTPPVFSVTDMLDYLTSNAGNEALSYLPTAYHFVADSISIWAQVPPYYEDISKEVRSLLNTVGKPIEVAKLKADYEHYPSDTWFGNAFIAAYAVPIDLRNADGTLLAEANWIILQWNMPDNPNAVIYGTGRTWEAAGAFEILGDFSGLQSLSY